MLNSEFVPTFWPNTNLCHLECYIVRLNLIPSIHLKTNYLLSVVELYSIGTVHSAHIVHADQDGGLG